MSCENKKWIDNENGICKKNGTKLDRNQCVVPVSKMCEEYKEGWS